MVRNAKKPKVIVESDRTVTARFGKREPTFADVSAVAHEHGLSSYHVRVFNANAPTLGWYGISDTPAWKATFTRRESLSA